MKKLFSFLLALIFSISAFAYGPHLNNVTFENKSTRETYDFYSSRDNMVVYHASGSTVSRRGEFSIGGSDRNVAHAVGERRNCITIKVWVGDREVKLTGIISYQQTGKVNYIRLNNGSVLTPR